MLKARTKADFAKETLPIIVSSYKIWPLASIINFVFVPAEKRLVFLSGIGLLWGIYMSLLAASLESGFRHKECPFVWLLCSLRCIGDV